MGSSPSIMKPDELIEFRKLNTSIENVEVPARPENRIVTDKKGFVIFGISILILIPFVVYTLVNVDFRYMNYDTDSCGNFCGHKNPVVEGVPCSGGDFTSKPVLGAMDECIARNSGPIMIVRQLRLLNNPSDAAFLLKDKSIWRSVLVIFLPTVVTTSSLTTLKYAKIKFVTDKMSEEINYPIGRRTFGPVLHLDPRETAVKDNKWNG